ncbi:HAD family hydrolase [Nocardioides limicola]|uniref:HAD family hydrolase n=1 Tax=Nocardioides limicola TaxID=2803368 RepID=UPI00193C7178|nr:HAD-IIB family hydrolase [Nocardioides sp. DJM-14]
MSAPRLVATDLDGTLLNASGEVTARTRRVLDALDAHGIPVVFTTGRPVRWMEHLWAEVGGHGLAICSNGGIVYDVAADRVRHALTIDPDTCVEVGRRLRRALPGTSFALERTGGFAREEQFMPRLAQPDGIPVGPLDRIVDHTVVKLLARHEELGPEPFWEAAEEQVGDLVTTTWSSTGTLVEMSARGVTKGSTLARLCAELGVARDEVIAFGDMPNDLPLLSWAGTSYAMENAHPEVRRTAGLVAPHHDDDGVARVLVDVFGLTDVWDAR